MTETEIKQKAVNIKNLLKGINYVDFKKIIRELEGVIEHTVKIE